jgi:hypothetical protein
MVAGVAELVLWVPQQVLIVPEPAVLVLLVLLQDQLFTMLVAAVVPVVQTHLQGQYQVDSVEVVAVW